MLTFLRKIRKSLLEPLAANEGTAQQAGESSQKYLIYAIGEIALVVVGILIALQINNWNEERKEREIERVVLEDIKDNIIRNNELIKSALEVFEQINRSANIVKVVMNTNTEYSDTLNIHFSQSIRHGGFLLRLNSDGYESLKNIGFGIIKNEHLKDEILSLFEVSYSNYQIELQWGNSVYSSGYGWWKDYFYTIQEDLFVPIDLDNIYNNKRLLSELNELAEVRISIQNEIEKCQKHNHLVLQLIKDELNEKETKI